MRNTVSKTFARGEIPDHVRIRQKAWERKAFILRELDLGKTQTQIAREMGRSPQTISVMAKIARRKVVGKKSPLELYYEGEADIAKDLSPREKRVLYSIVAAIAAGDLPHNEKPPMPAYQLINCPFCNGKAEVRGYESCDCCGKAYNGQVVCIRCGACVSHKDTDEEAIKIWNRRPTNTRIADIEVLAQMADEEAHKAESESARATFLALGDALNKVTKQRNALRKALSKEPAKFPDDVEKMVERMQIRLRLNTDGSAVGYHALLNDMIKIIQHVIAERDAGVPGDILMLIADLTNWARRQEDSTGLGQHVLMQAAVALRKLSK